MSIGIPMIVWLPVLIYGAVRIKRYGVKKFIHEVFDV